MSVSEGLTSLDTGITSPMTTTTFLGGTLLAAPFVAVVATGVAVGATAAVITDAVGLFQRLKH